MLYTANAVLPQILGSKCYKSVLINFENVEQCVRTMWEPLRKKWSSQILGYVYRGGEIQPQRFRGIALKKKDAEELVYQMLLHNSICTRLVQDLLKFENRLRVPVHMTRVR